MKCSVFHCLIFHIEDAIFKVDRGNPAILSFNDFSAGIFGKNFISKCFIVIFGAVYIIKFFPVEVANVLKPILQFLRVGLPTAFGSTSSVSKYANLGKSL